MEHVERVKTNEYTVITEEDTVKIVIGNELASAMSMAIENYIIWNEGRIKPQTMEIQNKKGLLAAYVMKIDNNSNQSFVEIEVDTLEEAEAIIRSIDFVEGNDYNMLRPLQNDVREVKSELPSMIYERDMRADDGRFDCMICNAAKTGSKKVVGGVKRTIQRVK